MDNNLALARILGIDHGSKRIGVAISDPLGIIAQPLTTVANDHAAIAVLGEYVRDFRVTTVVVGMPFNLKGEHAAKAKEVLEFIDRLKASFSCEVLTWDERFTSTIAQRTLRDLGTTKKQRRQDKGRVDSMAAALILQGFLDSTKHSRVC